QENPEVMVLKKDLSPLQRALLCTRLQAGCFRLLLLFKSRLQPGFFSEDRARSDCREAALKRASAKEENPSSPPAEAGGKEQPAEAGQRHRTDRMESLGLLWRYQTLDSPAFRVDP
ncbi:MAG TPA: hypothetical protein PKH31_08385, partial [Candidatus Sumerlaeota bacterium]|nr:hypothetical protein [Candidatus Sumerlaeota bacterium]